MLATFVRRLKKWWICNVIAAISSKRYLRMYVKFLARAGGVRFNGYPDHIDRSVYFDNADLSMITIGDKAVISREVILLVHDYSVTNALRSIGILTWHNNGSAHIIDEIRIGNNSFIGARAILLPGTRIGDNCIIGAGSVVKGEIPDNSVVIGNPAKVIKKTDEYAAKYKYSRELYNYSVPNK